jgi:hypothetical protein
LDFGWEDASGHSWEAESRGVKVDQTKSRLICTENEFDHGVERWGSSTGARTSTEMCLEFALLLGVAMGVGFQSGFGFDVCGLVNEPEVVE